MATQFRHPLRAVLPADIVLPTSGTLLLLTPGPWAEAAGLLLPGLRAVTPHNCAFDAELVARVAPTAIAAPVISAEGDILERATLLAAMGWGGLLCGFAAPPLAPGLVLRELRAACPSLRLCVALIEPQD